ncbi:MAG: FtsX-like permease family protein, partial [Bacteroidota bacterium]
SANRAKEVGVRKVMGVYRTQLISQFLAEAILISLVSAVIAYIITFLALPSFNDLAGKELQYTQLLDGWFLSFIFAIILLVGILAGSYPAFYLSMFKPVEVLKGVIRTGMKSGPIRSALVVFQFAISIMMIIGTSIVFDQLSYIQDKKLGYEKDQVVVVDDAWILREKANLFKNEASRNAGIINSSITSFSPTGWGGNSDLYFKNPSAAADESLVTNEAVVDHDFLSTMQMEMSSGRFFSKDFPTDSTTIVINETAARKFGLTNPVGQSLYCYEGNNDQPEVVAYKIIGVVKDFHFQSLRTDIAPLLMHLGQSTGYAIFKIQNNEIDATIDHLESTWQRFVQGQPFEYHFMDQQFDTLYDQENKVGKIFTVFALLAIVIACLGLFGLAAFTAEQKNKEIGIRKTLGATVPNIVNMLSKNFIKLVAISYLIAAPVAYYGMSYWLEDFAYRTNMKPMTFLISGALAIGIAWITISVQSWKAARSNPAMSLRSE